MSAPGTGKTLRKIAFIGFAIVAVVCLAGIVAFRNELGAAVALRSAQSGLDARIRKIGGPDARTELRDTSERSAMLAVVVPQELLDGDRAEETADAIWIAYCEEFAAGSLPIDTVVVTLRLDPALKSGHFFSAQDLVDRTGRTPAPLHPAYAAKGYYDASKEAVPDASGNGD